VSPQERGAQQFGPWAARGTWIVDAKNRGVAEVHQTLSRPSAQEAADIARVMAASPVMLKAMRLALEALPEVYAEGSKTDAAIQALAEAFAEAGTQP